MRIFTVSDIHVDYSANRKWLHQISRSDYQDDVLILAGDITDVSQLFVEAFEVLKKRFAEIFFVPGNHDLWVHRNGGSSSLKHFALIQQLAADYGVRMEPAHFGSVSIVPLFGWYDFSFGPPSSTILSAWMDFVACKWPADFDQTQITQHFTAMNEDYLDMTNQTIISFSHFLPRIDVMPDTVPVDKRVLYPVLGSSLLEQQLRDLGSDIHIYGHSHVNRFLTIDRVLYINNAFGYPHEPRARKELLQVIDVER